MLFCLVFCLVGFGFAAKVHPPPTPTSPPFCFCFLLFTSFKLQGLSLIRALRNRLSTCITAIEKQQKEADLKGFCFIDVHRRWSQCNNKASSVSRTIVLPVANVDVLFLFLPFVFFPSFPALTVIRYGWTFLHDDNHRTLWFHSNIDDLQSSDGVLER